MSVSRWWGFLRCGPFFGTRKLFFIGVHVLRPCDSTSTNDILVSNLLCPYPWRHSPCPRYFIRTHGRSIHVNGFDSFRTPYIVSGFLFLVCLPVFLFRLLSRSCTLSASRRLLRDVSPSARTPSSWPSPHDEIAGENMRGILSAFAVCVCLACVCCEDACRRDEDRGPGDSRWFLCTASMRLWYGYGRMTFVGICCRKHFSVERFQRAFQKIYI